MKTITEIFEREFKKMKERGWDKIFVLVDLHDTIFKACYNNPETCEWLGESKEALQELGQDPRVSLILWTSTYPEVADKYLQVFKESGIVFDYFNTNPEVRSDGLGCFTGKPYFNVIIDDKAGFTEDDWRELREGLYGVRD